MFNVLVSICGVVLTFGLIIFIHELGHFLMAKLKKVKVENFAFGLGPELWGVTRGETRYSLRAIPFGGMVKMAGESYGEQKGKPEEFLSKPWTTRIGIAAAGPLMNYCLAVLIFSLLLFIWGMPSVSEEPVVGEVVSGMPAEKAGIKAGDRIVKIDKEDIETWKELAEIIHQSAEKELVLLVVRGEEKIKIKVVPRLDKVRNRGLIGIAPQTYYQKIGFLKALYKGVEQVFFWTVFTFQYLGKSLIKFTKPEVAGPIGIAQIVAKATQQGVVDFLYLLGLISTGVAIFNFLPIPILDGGAILLFFCEGIKGKPLNKKTMQVANIVGLALLISIVILVTFSDLGRLMEGFWKGDVKP